MSDAGDYCLVYVTTSDAAEARKLAHSALDRRLAACANILPEMESLYWWNGAIETAYECVLLFKTRRSLAHSLMEKIKVEHSYECPAILEVPIEGGNPDFLQWIGDETVARVDHQ